MSSFQSRVPTYLGLHTNKDCLALCMLYEGPSEVSQSNQSFDINNQFFLGIPSVPILSCVDLFEDDSGAVNVTVRWTLSGGDSADFYLVNISTNSSQIPYGGLLNITNASVTQYELTAFIIDCEYNITVQGVNCGSQEGVESEPLIVTPQGMCT